MDREPVKSSHLRSVGYDPEKQVLEVEFQSGKVYEYRGVAPGVHASLVGSDSPGRFFSERIRPSVSGSRVS